MLPIIIRYKCTSIDRLGIEIPISYILSTILTNYQKACCVICSYTWEEIVDFFLFLRKLVLFIQTLPNTLFLRKRVLHLHKECIMEITLSLVVIFFTDTIFFLHISSRYLGLVYLTRVCIVQHTRSPRVLFVNIGRVVQLYSRHILKVYLHSLSGVHTSRLIP